jgi:CMP-N,N'-diacetyllegionaminic acid synthase
MKVIGLIPARKGSKGIPDKNLIEFCGKPLLSWTVDAALESGVFDQVIVSTDYQQSALPSMNGITVFDKRPPKLCSDKASLDLTLLHCLKYDFDVLFLLQPTSPLRDGEEIKRSWEAYQKCKRDSLISVAEQHPFIWVDKAAKDRFLIPIGLYNPQRRPNRQQRKDWYFENGAIYITTRRGIELTGCRINGSVHLFPMPKWKSIEIDDREDLTIAESLYEYHRTN